MTHSAVLFDFSGTLFRLEEDESWAADLTHADGEPFDYHHQAELMRRMTAPVGLTVELAPDDEYAWHNRDLDPKLHRRAYLAILKASGVPNEEQAASLYSRLVDPDEWTPYPDTGEVLEQLHRRSIRTAVVSNIAFDMRPAFAVRGWDKFVDEFVLSFEVGVIKPHAEIFSAALDRLGVGATSTLMVGDSAEADGGAQVLGCDFALVEPLPTNERPDALVQALRSHAVLPA